MRKRLLSALYGLMATLTASAQLQLHTEAQLTTSSGEFTPLWLQANRYGLSSLEKTNGYLRAALSRPTETDSLRQWRRGICADVAVATGFTSTMVVQQLYGEIGWKKGLLTIGAKEQPMELKNQELSSGAQTLGINARPVPGVRIELKDYWDVPGLNHWIGFKGHIFYGKTTDDDWQVDFTQRQEHYTENSMLHTKAGYLHIGPNDKPLQLELGLEMGCQFGGTSHMKRNTKGILKNESGFKSFIHAFIPGGAGADETDYRNEEGNHVGSLLARINYEGKAIGASLYIDHFFEDQSGMFHLDYDGYGSGENWDKWEHFNWMIYDLRDMQVGVELRLKHCRWVQTIVAEYLYTKYQSGPIYHDHTRIMSDHVSGTDDYYNHHIFTGWQHWGQVMGNPLYRSPLYNDDGTIYVQDNRFTAWHFGLSGTPVAGLHYRLLATWQRGLGTYKIPYPDPRRNVSLLAEASYVFPQHSKLGGWSVRGAVAADHGKLLGNNSGVQLTIGRQMNINIKKKKATHRP